MCEQCTQIAANIDPKLMQMVVVNSETGETPEEANMPAEDIAEIEAMQNMFAGMMGLSYATAWFNICQTNNPMESHMMGNSIMTLTHKGIEEASAYNYVVNQVRH